MNLLLDTQVFIGAVDDDPKLSMTAWSTIEETDAVYVSSASIWEAAVARLPLIHRDPFDRLLLAQAISEPLHFLTADEKLSQYSELVRRI